MAIFSSDFFVQVTLIIPGVPGTGNIQEEFTFADQPDIRNARLLSLETYFQEDLTHAQPSTTPVIPGNLANKLSIILQTNDPDDAELNFASAQDTVRWWPLTAFHLVQNNNALAAGFVRDKVFWRNRYIIWDKTRIKVSPGGLKNTSDVAVVIGCHYSWKTPEGKKISRRN